MAGSPDRPCPFPKRFPSQLVRDDAFYMWHAYNLAIDAWRRDEVPVGAVVVHDARIIAQAHNQVESAGDPTAHAEMLALTAAATAVGGGRLHDCTLYVTKEPCPMCAGAVVIARVGRVVFGLGDPKMGALGGAANLAGLPGVNHRPVLAAGVLAEESRALLQAYFAEKRSAARGPGNESAARSV